MAHNIGHSFTSLGSYYIDDSWAIQHLIVACRGANRDAVVVDLLVIQTPEANLSRGMHWLNGTYAGLSEEGEEHRGIDVVAEDGPSFIAERSDVIERAEAIAMRGGSLRRLIAWIGWHEGLTTLRSIAASLRLRSEGHVSGMIRRCEREFAHDAVLLEQLDLALVTLRA